MTSAAYKFVITVWFVAGALLGGSIPAIARDNDRSWTMQPHKERFFYFARGQAVRGQEFGFFKDPADCSLDTLWLTLSSSRPGVNEYAGREVTLVVRVDGQDTPLSVPLVNVGSSGFAYVLIFTNYQAEEDFLQSLAKGKQVNIRMTAPEPLRDLLDVRQEDFVLEGFDSSRRAAAAACVQAKSEM